ncbi:CoA pyrophosphatase [Patulibacter sp. NPDC049589]|uniref:NUDIX hydrolase n=1 Tax=Patulibacter sp. NPDC049589 TaxID=3154731 RepID=UPI00342E38E4
MTDTQRWLERVDVRPEATPPALAGLVRGISAVPADELTRNDPAATVVAARQAAVLVLLATDGPHGPDVLLQQRAGTMRTHAGEVSFPGGSRESVDRGPVDTALREAVEETGLGPAGVDALAVLPRVHIPPSRFDVTAVLAHWRVPSPVLAVDARETERVMRVPLATLAEPAHRFQATIDVRWRGPAFTVDGAVVWGFTGEILAAILRLGGWERPWDSGTVVELDTL